MQKIGYFDLETGVEVSSSDYERLRAKYSAAKIKKLIRQVEIDPFLLSLEDLVFIKKVNFNNLKEDLSYPNGGFFVAIKKEKSIINNLSLSAIGFLHIISSYTNKEGVILYSNNKPIRSFKDLIAYFNVSVGVWRGMKDKLIDGKLIVKQPFKGENYLLLSPFFSYSNKQISEIRFLAFKEEIEKVISKIDYAIFYKMYYEK